MNAPRILVKIAAYRDPELPKTIHSAIDNAVHPEKLRFAIVNQHDSRVDEISLAEWADDHRFRVMNVYYTQTLGLGWARYSCDTMWRSEEFTLQIDSHMRFDAGWDVTLHEDWLEKNDPNAVLTGYPKGYEYGDDGQEVIDEDPGPNVLLVSNVNELGESNLTSSRFDNPQQQLLLVAGGFQFAPGAASKAVPNDRRLQYGDELIHSLKLFTSGYNVYSPRTIPLAHFYQRADKSAVRMPAQDFANSVRERNQAIIRTESAKANLALLFGGSESIGTVRSRQLFLKNLTGYMGVPWPEIWKGPAYTPGPDSLAPSKPPTAR